MLFFSEVAHTLSLDVLLTAGRYSSRQLPKRLPERILALAYEVVGALAGTLAGSFFAVKELFIAAESHIKRAVGHAKKAK